MLGSIGLSLLALVLFSRGPAPVNDQPAPYEVPEAYEIYAAIMPLNWPVTVARRKKLIIRAETADYEMCLKPEGDSIPVVGPAIANYLQLNKKTWRLQKSFQIEQPYDLILAEDLEGIFREGAPGWKAFNERYPDSDGWIELSAVGFNESGTIAVVYVAHHCGGLCGEGEFHVLEKKDGKWQPLKWKGSSCSWVS
jgi:hypothetical protein